MSILMQFSTAAAGVACGAQYGVASNCKLCSVKVVKDDEQDWIDGINFIRETCTATESLCVVDTEFFGIPFSAALNLKNAIISAIDSGVVVVMNAGVAGMDACVGSEQAIGQAITVGFSTKIDTKTANSNFGACVDVYAPDEDVIVPGISGPDDFRFSDIDIGSGTARKFQCCSLCVLIPPHVS